MTPARQFFAVLLAFSTLIAGCGGSVGPSPVVVDPLTITVQPASAVIYPGVATTLVITGGTGSYSVVSDNQAVVPIVSPATGHSLTVIANPVSADTVVNLSVRDTGTAPQKTVVLTVRPGTIANSITVAPVSTACAPAICTGDEALITATISQAGIPLPARGVRFDVISGDVRFIGTPLNTTPDAMSQITVSDAAGVVRVRMRVLPGVADQTALIQITDPETLAFQRVAITIRQNPGPGGTSFFVVPSSLTFTGPSANVCATDPVSSITIFGGTPPYNVVATAPLSGGGIVMTSGTPVSIRGNGSTCFTNVPVTVTDASGRTIVATFSSAPGTGPAPATRVSILPATGGAITSCGGSISLAIQGGATGATFGVASSSSAVTLSIADRTITATRAVPGVAGPSPITSPTTVTVSATDGLTTGSASITVPGSCP